VKRYGTGKNAKLRKKIDKEKDKIGMKERKVEKMEKQLDRADKAKRKAEQIEKAINKNERQARIDNEFKIVQVNSVDEVV
jgi:hypothetical protein